MKMSTHGRYGLRFMIDLAANGGAGPVPLKAVAQRQGISMKYLWHIVRLLRQAGLIKSRRGLRGGYLLAQPPDKITVADIVMNLEGGCLTVDCVRDNATCKRSSVCQAHALWRRLERDWVGAMARVSLQELLGKPGPSDDYVI
ncbi:MAG: Rrf2 family transcriptional regulator [Kiritimatiellia bacterium]|nr:RrF2 family transcriptional regulator [Lentisphaerota bacterium]